MSGTGQLSVRSGTVADVCGLGGGPPLQVMSTRALQSSMRDARASEEKPPNTTECTAPMRAHASCGRRGGGGGGGHGVLDTLRTLYTRRRLCISATPHGSKHEGLVL